MFGSARFGIRAPANSVPFEGRTMRRAVLAALARCIAILAVAASESLHSVLEWLTRCLVPAAAVFTADFIAGAGRAERKHKVDWIGVIALAAGLAAPMVEMPSLTEPWGYPWLLLSYAVSFISCLSLRTTRRLFARRLQLQ